MIKYGSTFHPHNGERYHPDAELRHDAAIVDRTVAAPCPESHTHSLEIPMKSAGSLLCIPPVELSKYHSLV
ncbi:conserved hypothetical protein [Mycobacterium pseudoshottsii JCM 15466]|nr:hypothetical protein [Mycobacterium pseudoshottsii]GAQ40996.1 conserved hypothetical protein [Mycobacterium pseudoshottsii JCM 15466]